MKPTPESLERAREMAEYVMNFGDLHSLNGVREELTKYFARVLDELCSENETLKKVISKFPEIEAAYKIFREALK